MSIGYWSCHDKCFVCDLGQLDCKCNDAKERLIKEVEPILKAAENEKEREAIRNEFNHNPYSMSEEIFKLRRQLR